ncbi:GNAT family N-acetyltransferase [Streptomyces longisporoflavus]|uniref:GNAT family N-acetyltransferase n=1 Tax=Streptomyces longisporoflavus TaxID=28044 RepID=A0ABW7QHV8_9ACTN
MSDLHIRCATSSDIDAVLRFWREAAEGTSISDDHEGVARLLARDPEALLIAERDGSALLAAAEERFLGLGGRRGDAMVLDRNERAQHAWRAAGYAPQPQWSRWVKHLGD